MWPQQRRHLGCADEALAVIGEHLEDRGPRGACTEAGGTQPVIREREPAVSRVVSHARQPTE
jgi:hypothetical protein